VVDTLDLQRPRVDPDLILRLQKYRRPDQVPPVVVDAARRMAHLAETLAAPCGWMRRTPVIGADPDGGGVRLADGIAFQSRALARLLRPAAEAVLIILTVGPGIEARADELMREEQFADALLLDTAGRVAIDAVIRDVRQRLRGEASGRGLQLTPRLAPGFADWPLEEQRALFAAFECDSLTVRLTEGAVMLPRKSVSGVYGLAPTAGIP